MKNVFACLGKVIGKNIITMKVFVLIMTSLLLVLGFGQVFIVSKDLVPFFLQVILFVVLAVLHTYFSMLGDCIFWGLEDSMPSIESKFVYIFLFISIMVIRLALICIIVFNIAQLFFPSVFN